MPSCNSARELIYVSVEGAFKWRSIKTQVNVLVALCHTFSKNGITYPDSPDSVGKR